MNETQTHTECDMTGHTKLQQMDGESSRECGVSTAGQSVTDGRIERVEV